MLRRALGTVLLVVLATAFALGVAEAVLRLQAPQPSPKWTPPPLAPEDRDLEELRGVRELVRRGQRGLYRGVVHRTNSRGVRGPEYAPIPPPGTFRIVVLGDSYTMGQGVPEELSYPAAAERLLNERGDGRRYEVINLGVAGMAIRHSVHRLKHVGNGYRPHLIVYGFTPNDVMGPDYVEPAPEVRAATQELIHRYDDSPSLLLRTVWPRLVLTRSAFWPIPGTYEHALEENYFRIPESARQISDGLDDLAGMAKAQGICAHVFVHTRMNQLWIHPFTRIYRHVAEAARERGMSASLSLPWFRGRDAAELRLSIVDTHPNDEGHRLHAEALVAGLEQELPEHCWRPGHFVAPNAGGFAVPGAP